MPRHCPVGLPLRPATAPRLLPLPAPRSLGRAASSRWESRCWVRTRPRGVIIWTHQGDRQHDRPDEMAVAAGIHRGVSGQGGSLLSLPKTQIDGELERGGQVWRGRPAPPLAKKAVAE